MTDEAVRRGLDEINTPVASDDAGAGLSRLNAISELLVRIGTSYLARLGIESRTGEIYNKLNEIDNRLGDGDGSIVEGKTTINEIQVEMKQASSAVMQTQTSIAQLQGSVNTISAMSANKQ